MPTCAKCGSSPATVDIGCMESTKICRTCYTKAGLSCDSCSYFDRRTHWCSQRGAQIRNRWVYCSIHPGA